MDVVVLVVVVFDSPQCVWRVWLYCVVLLTIPIKLMYEACGGIVC